MFTGIIEKTATIKNLTRKQSTCRLTIYIKKDLDSVKKGDSISVNGACLTVVDIRKNHLTFDIMHETFRNTSFSHSKSNDIVNIERSLEWKSRLDGHFVLGHVDSVQKIKTIKKNARPYVEVAISPDDKTHVVRKGSIAIEGISLTIGEVYKDRIRVYIIPYTLQNTNLKYKKTGDWVNIEFDILGKYAHKSPQVLTEEFLKNKGFI